MHLFLAAVPGTIARVMERLTASTLLALTFATMASLVIAEDPTVSEVAERAGDKSVSGGAAPPDRARCVAIGDVHGDFSSFRGLLEELRLVDADGHWSGGKQRLVQTGDIVDRGPDSRAAIELLMRLEPQASEVGGQVTVLLGNHEVMNLTARMTYVSAEEYAAFASDESTEFRARRRAAILALIAKGSPLLRSDYYRGLARQIHAGSFDRAFPAGYFAHRAAFSPDGKIGRWLLERPFVHKGDGALFVHAGISPRLAGIPAADLDRLLRDELREYLDLLGELVAKQVFDADLGFDELALLIESERRAGGPHRDIAAVFARLARLLSSGLLLAADGPVWYRGLAEGAESTLESTVERILEVQDVDRIVVGHTQPKSLRIEGRFGNSVILIDTGMNQRFYGGRPSALLFQPSGSVEVFEPDPKVRAR